MPNRVQTLRSNVAGNRPSGRQPGELYVNWPDKQLGVIDSTSTALDLIAIRFFSANTSYNIGDYVVQSGKLYTAKVAVSPGPFNTSQWSLTGGIVAIGDTPPLAPNVGALWWDSVGGNLYVFYDDGTSQQWVVAVNISGAFVPLSGGTMTGNLTVPTLTASNIIAPQAVLPNIFDNGDMWVDQHNSGAVVHPPVNAAVVGPDRWWVTNSQINKMAYGQNYNGSVPCPGFQYYLGAQTTAAVASPVAADYWGFWQSVEADMFGNSNWGTANAVPVTLSFWVFSSLTGTFGGCMQSSTTTPRCYAFTYNIPTANVWTKITVTIPGDTFTPSQWPITGNTSSFYIQWDLGGGSNYRTSTVNSWFTGPAAGIMGVTGTVRTISTLNAKYAITGIKLEYGTVATPYPVEDLQRKMARCQRYYQVFAGAVQSLGYAAGAGGLGFSSVSLLTQMRTPPTVGQAGTPTYGNCSALTANASATAFSASVTATAAGQCSVIYTPTFSAEI